MIPHRFRCLAEMPVNVAGKIDVKALPPSDEPAKIVTLHPDRPRSPVRRDLTRIIAEILGCPSPGDDDDFFALGGDSIQSIRVAGRARDQGYPLTVRDIFEQRTISHMAAVLEERAPTGDIRPAEDGSAEIALMPIQRWFSISISRLPATSTWPCCSRRAASSTVLERIGRSPD